MDLIIHNYMEILENYGDMIDNKASICADIKNLSSRCAPLWFQVGFRVLHNYMRVHKFIDEYTGELPQLKLTLY